MELRTQISDRFVRAWTRRRLAALLGVMMLVAGSVAYAIDSKPPYTLAPGSPISSTELNTMFSQLYSASMPPGAVVPFAGPATSVPDGWVPCDNTCYAIDDPKYAGLWKAIGKSHGQKTDKDFCVPDLRGRFVRGVDTGASRDNGPRYAPRAVGFFLGEATGLGSQEDAATGLPNNSTFGTSAGSHTHDVVQYGYATATAAPGDGSYGSELQKVWAGLDGVKTKGTGNHTHTITGGDPETRPENLALLYMIKL